MHSDAAVQEAQAEKPPSPIPYTAEEVGRIFQALLESFDFKEEMRELGISVVSVFKRKEAQRQFSALCVGLWNLALRKSFPQDASRFYCSFLQTSPLFAGDDKRVQQMRESTAVYSELLIPKGDTDFSAVAEQMAKALKLEAAEQEQRRLHLKLSLLIRNLYSLIFDRLV